MALPLDPDLLPAFADLPETGEHNGPSTLDRETVTRLAEYIQSGRESLPAGLNMNALVETVDQVKFDQMFRTALDSVTLRSKISTIFDARATALSMVLREVIGSISSDLQGGRIDVGALDAYLSLAASRLPARFDSAQRELLRDEFFLLTTAEVSTATGLSEGQLSQWRFQGKGPRFVKLTQGRDSIRYPAVALLRWVESL